VKHGVVPLRHYRRARDRITRAAAAALHHSTVTKSRPMTDTNITHKLILV